jgi:hypothetical protein
LPSAGEIHGGRANAKPSARSQLPTPGHFQFDPGFIFVSLLTSFFASFAATLDDHPIPLSIGGLNAFFFANGGRALLPTHAIGVHRRRIKGGRGHHGGGARKCIQYYSYMRTL